MNDKMRKRIIFAVFAVTLVWGYFNIFKKPQAAVTSNTGFETVEALSPNSPAAGLDSLTLSQLKTKSWGDDPFKKGSVNHSVAREVVMSASPQWNLSGIVFSPTDPLAIVNGKMVRVGDNVGDATVKRIEKKTVTLDYGGSSITLTVNKG